MMNTYTGEKHLQRYKIIRGNSLDDLETKVNYFIEKDYGDWRIHGDIQMYSYSEFAQALTEINQNVD